MLNGFSTAGISPDVTFLLDLDEQTAYERRHGRSDEEDRLEAEGLAFMRKVREGYLAISRNNGRIHVIDAASSPDEIIQRVKQVVWEVLEL